MKVFSNFTKWYNDLQPKQLVLMGVFMLALASSISLGFASRQNGMAAVIRDSDPVNSIDGCSNNGGIGAADASELIKDVRDAAAGNCRTQQGANYSDLPTIYGHFGLTADKYDQFISEAKDGILYRDGHVEVDGITVMTDALTMGRTTQGKPADIRKPITIGGKTYYQSAPSSSFAASRQWLPVMVLFDNEGAAKTVIMNACGNPVQGNPKKPTATCDALVKTQPDPTNKPNTYKFTTNATFTNNAVLSRVVYTFSDDNTTVTKTSLTDAAEHTFKKDGKVTVTVYAKTPSGKEIQAPAVANCEKQIKYVPPFYVCVVLSAVPIDQQMRSFRFTVKVNHDKLTTLKDADFTLDGTNTTTGVTAKDSDGNIYKEYSFNDEKEHTVVAKVNFTTVEGVKSADCQAKVTPKKLPKCEVPGFEHLPPNDERCGYCKPGIPKGDARCKEVPPTPEMPKTGPGSVVGLFAGTSLAGFVGHKLYLRRRNSC